MKRKQSNAALVEESTNAVIKRHGRVKNWHCIASVLAVAVLLFTTYTMILPAISMNKNLYCGQEEHIHTDSCSNQETACEKTEHTHGLMCYSNPDADVELSDVWEQSVNSVKLTGVWADDLVSIANSQLGYKESERNYNVNEVGNVCGYTRYGDWYGDAYGDWNSMFVAFCLNYAGISDKYVPYEANCENWIKQLSKQGMYEEAEGYSPQKGDLVFFVSSDEKSIPNRVGIVKEVLTDGDVPEGICVIEGDSLKQVEEKTYELSEDSILGYGKLPKETIANEKDIIRARALLSENDLTTLNQAEFSELLNKISPKDMQAYLESLSDEEHEKLMNDLPKADQDKLSEFIKDKQDTRANSIYVGYSKLSETMNAYEFARLDGGVGVRKMYLAHEDIYDQYTNVYTPTYQRQQELIDVSQVAYCFNHYIEAPTNTFKQTGRSEYYANSYATPSLFYSLVSSHVRPNDANTLYSKILNVAMNGYPNDYSGIQARYGLSDDEFRAITQYAIWYYTDSISIYVYNNSGYYMYADDTGTWLTLNSSNKPTAIGCSDWNWLYAYYELRNSTLDSATVNTSHINLFTNTTENFQHLLTVGREEQPAEPTEYKLRIRVNKTIDGGDTSITGKRFTFRLTGHGQDLTAQNDDYGDVIFPEIVYTQPGTYTYTVQEVSDNRDGVSYNFDKSIKTIVVTVTANDILNYDPDVTYYDYNEDVVFNNPTIVQNSLKLGKTVTGSAGDKDKLFTFSIGLRDNSFKTISGMYTVTPGAIEGVEEPYLSSITFNSGTATVTLKHGQYITIQGLPTGFFYTINENEWNQDGYTSSVTKGTSSNLSASLDGASGAVEVMFTNHKDAPPPEPVVYETQIRATKTLDGELPADGQFTFILRDSDGAEIDRRQNNADGEVIFTLTLQEMGTYTYTIEELNDVQEGITYDTTVKTVTVTVGNENLQKIINGSEFVGYNDSDDLYMNVDNETDLIVYCIDGTMSYPEGNYQPVMNPTVSQIEQQITLNNHGNDIAEKMRKLFYYFDTHSYTDMIGYSTLTRFFRQELVWCLTGNDDQQHWTYTNPLNKILAESNPPDNYTLVMFTSDDEEQPVMAGYMLNTETVYDTGNAEFVNYHTYVLPETGGTGTLRYTIGGLLLMSSALFLVYKKKLEGKKGEKSQVIDPIEHR